MSDYPLRHQLADFFDPANRGVDVFAISEANRKLKEETERRKALAAIQHGHDFNTHNRRCVCGLDVRDYHASKQGSGYEDRRPTCPGKPYQLLMEPQG